MIGNEKFIDGIGVGDLDKATFDCQIAQCDKLTLKCLKLQHRHEIFRSCSVLGQLLGFIWRL